MIEPLANTVYYLLISLTFLIIFLLISKNLRIFSIIGVSKSAVSITDKFNSIKIIYNFRINIWNKFIEIIKFKLFDFWKRIIKPLILFILKLLSFISMNLHKLENIISNHTTKSFIEVITEICLLCRKSVNAEIQNSWLIIIVLFVLIYFILTM